MRAIVPMHKAVNERVWKGIKQLEVARGSEKLVPSSSYLTLSIR